MISIDVFYDGWGEQWHWGTLATTTALTGRPVIVFEYSPEAQKKGPCKLYTTAGWPETPE